MLEINLGLWPIHVALTPMWLKTERLGMCGYRLQRFRAGGVVRGVFGPVSTVLFRPCEVELDAAAVDGIMHCVNI